MLQKFFSFIIKFKWVFIGVFIALTVFGGIMVFKTNIIYDLSGYVPTNSRTERAVAVLKSDFDDKGSAYVMIKGVNREEALTVQQELSEIEGVAIATFDQETDFKDGNVLYTISLDDYDATDEANATIKRIISYTEGKDAYLYGQSATSYFTRKETVDSILKIAIVIVIAIFAMLLFTSKTYFELIIMLLVFGVAVVINMGTNFVFPKISYISNLVALVLQLALSIDYSVVLLHRYMEERALSEARDAAVAALSKGILEIFSSSLTTVAGLCALIFMTLPIGVEMGLSLAKGIVFSLISVIFFMPCLLVVFDKPLKKSAHKNFVPNVTKPARAILKARKIIVPAFLIIVVLSSVGQFNNTYGININSSTNTINSQKVISKEFRELNTLVVIVPKGDYDKERALIEHVSKKDKVTSATALTTVEITEGLTLADRLTKEDAVGLCSSIGLSEGAAQVFAGLLFSSYKNEYDPNANEEGYSVVAADLLEFAAKKAETIGLGAYAEQLGQIKSARANFEGTRYARIMFNINSPMESAESYAIVEELYDELGAYYDEFYLAGESPACYDMANAFPRDNLFVCLFTAAFILVILLFTFRNLLLPLVLTLSIQGGIWINFVIPFLAGNSVFFIGYLLISAIQMGATIDYAIILTGRYNTEKKLTPNKLDAMANAENAVFPTIITSGIILTVAGFTLGLASTGIVAELGMLLGLGAAISMLVVLFVLPSLLTVCDSATEKASFSAIRARLKRIKKH